MTISELHEQYWAAIVSRCGSYLRRRGLPQHHAEDLAQATFLAAYQSHDRWDGRDIGHWLNGIADNQCSNFITAATSLKRRPANGLVSIDTIEPADHRPQADAAKREQGRRLRALLHTLPASEQAVLRGVYLDDLTLPEVAERLGVPIGTAKSRLNRGLNLLRAMQAKSPPRLDEPTTMAFRRLKANHDLGELLAALDDLPEWCGWDDEVDYGALRAAILELAA